MPAVLWSDEATDDLAAILEYIEIRNPIAASRLNDSIVQTVEKLPLMPFIFRAGRVAGTREAVVHPNYILVYQVGQEVIEILQVVHSRQEYPI